PRKCDVRWQGNCSLQGSERWMVMRSTFHDWLTAATLARSRNRQSDFPESCQDCRGSVSTIVTAITAAAARATTAVNAATGKTARACNSRPGFAHHEPTPFVFVVVQSLDRGLGLGIGIHLDKTK